MSSSTDPELVKRAFLTEVTDLALRADEAGLSVLSVALLLIIRGARQAPSTCRYLVNAGACTLDAVEAVHRDRRRAAKREPNPALRAPSGSDCAT